MPTGHDPTRLYRAPISPRCSVKLGAQAAWSKVKYSAQSSRKRVSSTKHVRFGSHGEVLIAYANTVEVWDWMPSSLQMLQLSEKVLREEADQREMFLVASTSVQGTIEDVVPLEMDQNSNTYKVMLAIRGKSDVQFFIRTFGQVFDSQDDEDCGDKPLILPPFVHGSYPYSCKGSDSFIGVATSEGSLTVFDVSKGHPLPMNFEVGVVNGQVMFDIMGRFLTFVASSDSEFDSPLTKMDVPSHNHSIYSKILQNISLTAIDGITKLSDLNSLKAMINDKSLKSNLKAYISNLINGFKESPRVVVMDLITQSPIASFHPPNGVSNLSLSPFNTHMTTITQRGDQIYKWDITRVPLEVSLLDIQIRGKTGSIVEETHWHDNDSFQIVTRSSGSIHCFQSDVSQNWVLPNMHASGLVTVKEELLALVGDELFVIDPHGNCNSKYTLPANAIAASLLPSYIPVGPVDDIIERTKSSIKRIPLAEIEIETCFLGQPLYSTDKVELATFQNDNRYWDALEVFGTLVECDRVDFGRGNGEPVFCGEKSDLESAMTSVLVFDEGL